MLLLVASQTKRLKIKQMSGFGIAGEAANGQLFRENGSALGRMQQQSIAADASSPSSSVPDVRSDRRGITGDLSLDESDVVLTVPTIFAGPLSRSSRTLSKQKRFYDPTRHFLPPFAM
jgi:hypothetical protein